ncbi:MATE family efflux transporter [Dehalococcoidia bacterium]|nr:MATE family efflux transporter [Dehalococcoidia bacterium]
MQNRKRTFLLSGIANYGAIIVSVVVGVISVPIGLHYFGPVLYGIWFVISSILAYLRISDFGVSLSTLTLMAQTPESSHQRIILRRSIGILLGISIVFIGLVLVAVQLFPGWVGILGKVPPNLQGEAATAALAIGILVLLQLPTTVFSAAFSGLQQVYWNRIYDVLSSMTALGALLTTVLIGGNLVTLAIFTGLGGLLVGIVSGVHLFLAHPQVRPRFTERVTDAPAASFLFTSGIRFLTLQIAVLIILNTDNIIITHFSGPEEVTPYAITFKLFQMGLMMVTATIIALWPMYGQALGRSDWEWIQRTYNRSVFSQIIPGGLIWIGGIIFSQAIITLWAGPVAYGGLLVASALGGFVYISAFNGSNASLINGLNPTNVVVIATAIDAVLNLTISLALVGPLGIGGVALGTVIAGMAIGPWFGPLYIRYRTSKRVVLEVKPVLMHLNVVILCVALALIVVLYLPGGWIQFISGITVIALYLALSWRVMPNDLQNLTRDILIKLHARVRAKIESST